MKKGIYVDKKKLKLTAKKHEEMLKKDPNAAEILKEDMKRNEEYERKKKERK